jgi:hypothetical protein
MAGRGQANQGMDNDHASRCHTWFLARQPQRTVNLTNQTRYSRLLWVPFQHPIHRGPRDREQLGQLGDRVLPALVELD